MEPAKNLPRPTSVGDVYLERITQQLDQMIQLFEAVLEPPQPEETVAPVHPLPGDFPGRAQLLDAGISSLEAVPRTMKELTAVAGIGEVTAQRILASLGGS